MTTINSIHHQQSGQITRNNALRDTAKSGSTDLPKLTKDESSLIEEKFSPKQKMDVYSMDGKVENKEFARGRNIDTRV
ncbi:MAG: hypothetical protein FH748_00835 [Balneolaceae bacterium]|nr:hypothetical protein [Balneolaceae bacterium]